MRKKSESLYPNNDKITVPVDGIIEFRKQHLTPPSEEPDLVEENEENDDRCRCAILSLEKNQWFFVMVTIWKLSKNEQKSKIFHRNYRMIIVEKWAKIQYFSYKLPYENCRKMNKNQWFFLGLPYKNCRKTSKNPWFFIGFILPYENCRKMSKIRWSFMLATIWEFSKNGDIFQEGQILNSIETLKSAAKFSKIF